MDPDVAFRMELRRLLHALHLLDFRQDLDEQAGFIQQFKGAARVAFRKHFEDLIADAFAADLVDLRCEFTNRGKGIGLDLVAETRSKANGAKHAEFVFRKAEFRSADGADDAALKVGLAADEVQNFAGDGIKQEAVDGEVAALNVEPGFRRKLDSIRMAAVRIGAVTAIGGNLNGVVVARSIFAVVEHGDEDDAELRSNGVGPGEDAHDFIRTGGGGNVIVRGFAPEQQITHTAADEMGRVAVVAQNADEARSFPGFFRC